MELPVNILSPQVIHGSRSLVCVKTINLRECAYQSITKNATLSEMAEKKGLEPGFPVLWEAVTAIDGPALCWLKGYFTFATAI